MDEAELAFGGWFSKIEKRASLQVHSSEAKKAAVVNRDLLFLTSEN
jgi:hypothetical protein